MLAATADAEPSIESPDRPSILASRKGLPTASSVEGGSCLSSRGLFEPDLTSLRTDTLGRQGSDVCGERVQVASESRAAVVDPDVLITDMTRGRTQNRINASNDAVVEGLSGASPS